MASPRNRRRSLNGLLAVAALLLPAAAGAQGDGEQAARDAAIAFCKSAVFERQSWSHAIEFNTRKTVACYNGEFALERGDSDLATLRQLAPGGTFVIRSPGGNVGRAMTIANLLRDKGAAVVAYQYCLSACADFILVATDTTFVVRDTLIAVHYGQERLLFCGDLASAYGGASCPKSRPLSSRDARVFTGFYESRVIDRGFAAPAQSGYVRNAIKAMSLTSKRAVEAAWWTLSPEYLAATFKTKILYEAYYRDEEEVERLARKLRMGRVIYDP